MSLDEVVKRLQAEVARITKVCEHLTHRQRQGAVVHFACDVTDDGCILSAGGRIKHPS
jgi:hypothetical protein